MTQQTLTYELLRRAVEGEAVALRATTRLLPIDGAGGKVFPPTYQKGEGNNAKPSYSLEERWVDGEDDPVKCVLLNSVPAQANRAELALRDAHDAGDLIFPVPSIDFSDHDDLVISSLGRATALDLSHRMADAYFRDSNLDGVLLGDTDVGKALAESSPNDATAMFLHCPTSLLFGQWFSTGPKGGLGPKFQRAFVSEIVGYHALPGEKTSSRVDRFGIPSGVKLYEAKDKSQVWTTDESEAVGGPKNPKLYKEGDKKKEGKPSAANFGNVTPSIDEDTGGVSIRWAEDVTHISLAALRKLRFAGDSIASARSISARTAVAALGCAAVAYSWHYGYDLRSRCLLVPTGDLEVEVVAASGKIETLGELPVDVAREVMEDAAARVADDGFKWEAGLALTPSDRLVGLLRKSEKLIREGAADTDES